VIRKHIIATISLLLVLGIDASAQKKDRGLDLNTMPAFVKKGSWMVGGTGSWSIYDYDHAKVLVIDDLTTNGYKLNVSPAFCYMFKDNMGAGLRVGYQRNMLKVDNAEMGFGDIGINVNDFHTLSHVYTAQGIFRNYIPIGNSKRIALYDEAQLSFKYGEGKVVNGNDGLYEGSYQKAKAVGLNLCPGIVAFANDHWAVDVSVNMLGLNLSEVDQTRNQVYEGSRSTTSLSFKVNILAIGFGLYYYL